MQSKDDEEDWKNVLNSEMWELDVFDKKLSPALLFSYYDLPPAIKQCFSYCAIFPKDHFIEIDELVKLWMAQSYLSSKAGREMENVGRKYFENLAARSFFQNFEKDDEGNIVRCKMHDIVHDFAQFLTNKECLILEDDSESLKPNLSLRKVRHATLIVHESARLSLSINNVGNLHTFLIMLADFLSIDVQFLPDSFQHFKYLRAIDLRENDSIEGLPREVVGKFIHLRYLNLSYCRNLVTLPETISELCNLQTLNVLCCASLGKLPQGIKSLINLRRLEIGGISSSLLSLPKGVGRLTSLRTLPLFIVADKYGSDVCKIEEMRNLKELRGELETTGLGSVEDAGEAERAELKNKKHLHHFTLNFFGGMRTKDVAEALQQCHVFFPPSVGVWEKWEVEEEKGRKAMPCLLSLTLNSCPKLAAVPDLLLQRTPPLKLTVLRCLLLEEDCHEARQI